MLKASASVAWKCLISQIGFKFVKSKSLFTVCGHLLCIKYIHMYMCMCLLYIFVWALQFWQSSSQGSSQKVKKGYHHEITALFACLSLFCLAPPRCLTLLPEALDWDCTYPWAHSSLGWILSLLSAASDVYYIALYKHICIYAPCGSTARICDGALNTNANLCSCVRVCMCKSLGVC